MVSLNHSFNVELAQLYGIECALLIHHLQYWIQYNRSMKRNFHDGHTWMFQTQKELSVLFPYLSVDSVQRNISKLVQFDIIIIANYNKNKIDKTNWYAFKDEAKFLTKLEGIPSDKSSNSENKNAPKSTFDRSAISREETPRALHVIPNTITTKSKQEVYKDNVKETISFSINHQKTLSISKRYKLSKDQTDSLQWLLDQNIDTSEGNLAWWAREYSLKRLKQVFLATKKEKRASIGAYMNSLLKANAIVESESSIQNLDFALDYKKANRWNALEILPVKNPRYVMISLPSGSTQDLDLQMAPQEFLYGLLKLHENYEMGKQ